MNHLELTLLDAGGSAPEALRMEISRARRVGRVLLALKGFNPPLAGENSVVYTLLDAFVQGLGCRGLGERWREIAVAEAADLLEEIVSRDQAYNTCLIGHDQAQLFVQRFMDLFSPGPIRVFTNSYIVSSPGRDLLAYCPLTPATFNTGIVAVAGTWVGILWVEDED